MLVVDTDRETYRVTVDVLGDGVHDDIRTVVQGVLEVRAQEGVVHHDQDSMLMSDGSNLADIHQPESRVRRGLDPDEFGVIRADQLLNVGFDAGREGDMDAMRGGDLGEVTVCASVDVRDRHDVGAGGKGLKDDGGGRGAGGEGQSISGVFESGNDFFKLVTAAASSR